MALRPPPHKAQRLPRPAFRSRKPQANKNLTALFGPLRACRKSYFPPRSQRPAGARLPHFPKRPSKSKWHHVLPSAHSDRVANTTLSAVRPLARVPRGPLPSRCTKASLRAHPALWPWPLTAKRAPRLAAPPALRQTFGRCADLGARAAQTTSFRKLETLAPPPQTILALEAESEPLPAPAPALGRPCGVLGGAVCGSHLAARPVVQVSFRQLGSGCTKCSHAHARSRSKCPWLLQVAQPHALAPPRGARSQRCRDGIPKW